MKPPNLFFALAVCWQLIVGSVFSCNNLDSLENKFERAFGPIFFDHFISLPRISRVEGRVGEESPAPNTAATAVGGAGVLLIDRLVQEVHALAKATHPIPGDRLPNTVDKGPTHPLKSSPPGKFLKGHYVTET